MCPPPASNVHGQYIRADSAAHRGDRVLVLRGGRLPAGAGLRGRRPTHAGRPRRRSHGLHRADLH